MWGVVKGFQIACNLAGPSKSDQPSGKVLLVIRCRTRQRDNQHGIRTTREDGGVLKLVERLSLKSTLHYRR